LGIPFPDLYARPSIVGSIIEAFTGHLLISITLVLLIGLTMILFVRARNNRTRIKIIFASPSRRQLLPIGQHPARLLFSRPIDHQRSEITLIGPKGVSRELTIGSMSAIDVISSLLPIQSPGEYVLRWRVLGADGKHGAGNIPFNVGPR
jgi:methionine-rich copper-binding protein CopC